MICIIYYSLFHFRYSLFLLKNSFFIKFQWLFLLLPCFVDIRKNNFFRPYTDTRYVYTPNFKFPEMAHTNCFSSIRKTAYQPFIYTHNPKTNITISDFSFAILHKKTITQQFLKAVFLVRTC